MSPRLLAVAAIALGATFAVIVVLVVLTSMHHASPVATSSTAGGPGSGTAAPPVPPDPKTDEIVAAAQAKIDKGDYATAIDELTALEAANPERADVHMLLERAYTGVRNPQSAMREAGFWLAADPNAVADIHLQEDVRNAALFHDVQDEAFTLLETKMGMRGIDILYDIAFGSSGRMYPQAAARARRSLEGSEVRKRASPALAVLMQFRDAKTCDQKHALLDARPRSRRCAPATPAPAVRGHPRLRLPRPQRLLPVHAPGPRARGRQAGHQRAGRESVSDPEPLAVRPHELDVRLRRLPRLDLARLDGLLERLLHLADLARRRQPEGAHDLVADAARQRRHARVLLGQRA